MRNGKKIKNRNNRQKRYYSGKKKRHTIKTQVVFDVKSSKIVSVHLGCGSEHDFKLFKRTKLPIHSEIDLAVDSGYTGLHKIHAKSQIPKRRSKKRPLTKEDKRQNRKTAKSQVLASPLKISTRGSNVLKLFQNAIETVANGLA